MPAMHSSQTACPVHDPGELVSGGVVDGVGSIWAEQTALTW